MTERIDRNRNTNTEATISDLIVVNGTSVTAAAANPRRQFLHISLAPANTNEEVFVKLQAASVDNDFKGILLQRNLTGNSNAHTLEWTMPTDNIYTGEVSVISDIGPAGIYVTEY